MKHCDLFAAALLVLLSAGPLAAQGPAAQYAQADIQFGSRIYAAQCSVCHGANGDTVAGVDLRSGQFPRAHDIEGAGRTPPGSDAQLGALITTGIPGTAMPAFKFAPAEVSMVIAYLRNMRDFDARSVTIGEPSRGQQLFAGRGQCASCHRVDGRGPRVAPELSEIGAVRGADALQRSLVDPNGSILPSNRSVRAVTRDGKVVAGRRLNEDTYTVQLIDEQEQLVSLTKSALRDYAVIMTSSMPSYKDTLSSQELADVVAYLLSLKGLK
jgi:cytochrome c oxidase cbb3-type subunit 3